MIFSYYVQLNFDSLYHLSQVVYKINGPLYSKEEFGDKFQ